MPQQYIDQNFADIIVIGAGMAGASVAAELAPHARVLLLEGESQPGYHSTGRSAALLVPDYGPPAICALTRASQQFFDAPPDGFTDHALISPRQMLALARQDQLADLEKAFAELHPGSSAEWLTGAAIKKVHPLVRDGYAKAAVLQQGAFDIDVHALHQGYLRAFKSLGGVLLRNHRVNTLHYSGGAWNVTTRDGTYAAPIIVNAAGAWAGELGITAKVEDIALVPKRRTAITVASPDGIDTDPLPIADGANEEFYLKPDAGRLLLSPADKTPTPPCDAQPDEMDIAVCIDRIEQAFEIKVRRILSKWAGLRSFVADGSPVVGYSQIQPGFFWLAGQGGYGIQTAPALSKTAAAMVLKSGIPADITDHGFDAADVSPQRFSA
jgi:D-arginine dehydrogenase